MSIDALTRPIAQNQDRFLTMAQVKSLVALGKSTIYELIKEGKFPSQYKIGCGAARWSENEILEWIEEQKASRENLIDG